MRDVAQQGRSESPNGTIRFESLTERMQAKKCGYLIAQ
jgi:hypothetical protein